MACRIKRPLPAPLTMEAVNGAGAYLLDVGRIFVLWIGSNIGPSFMSQVSPCAHNKEQGRASESFGKSSAFLSFSSLSHASVQVDIKQLTSPVFCRSYFPWSLARLSNDAVFSICYLSNPQFLPRQCFPPPVTHFLCGVLQIPLQMLM